MRWMRLNVARRLFSKGLGEPLEKNEREPTLLALECRTCEPEALSPAY